MDPNSTSLDDIIKRNRKVNTVAKKKKAGAAAKKTFPKKAVRGRGSVRALAGRARKGAAGTGKARGGVQKGGAGVAARKARVAQQLIKKALLLRREAARANRGRGGKVLAVPRVTPARVKKAARSAKAQRIRVAAPLTDVHSRLGGGRAQRGGRARRGGGAQRGGGARGRLGGRVGLKAAGGRRGGQAAQIGGLYSQAAQARSVMPLRPRG